MEPSLIPVRTSLARKFLADAGSPISDAERAVLSAADGHTACSFLSSLPGSGEGLVDALFESGLLKDNPLGMGASDEPAAPAEPAPREPDGMARMRAGARERSNREALEKRNSKTLREADRTIRMEEVSSVWTEAEERAKREYEERKRLEEELTRARDEARREAEKRAMAEAELLASEKREAVRLAAQEAAESSMVERERRAAEIAEAELRAKNQRLGITQRRRRRVAIGVFAVIGAVAASFSYREFPVDAAECSAAASEWLGSKVEVSSCHAIFLPDPSVVATGISGFDGNLEIREARLFLSPLSIPKGSHDITGAEISDVRIMGDGLFLLSNSKPLPKNASISNVTVNNAVAYLADISPGPMSGAVAFVGGRLDAVRLQSQDALRKLTVKTTPGVAAFSFEGKGAFETGSALGSVSDPYVSGTLARDEIRVEAFSLRMKSGDIKGRGSYKYSHGDQRHALSGNFESSNSSAERSAPWLFSDGLMSVSGSFSSTGETVVGVARNLSAEGSMEISGGVFKHLDFANSLGVGRSSSGGTRFSGLSAKFSLAPGSATISELKAESKPYEIAVQTISRAADGSVDGTSSAEAKIDTETLSGKFRIQGNDSEIRLFNR